MSIAPQDPRNCGQMYVVDFGNRVEMYRTFPAARARVLEAIVAGEGRPVIRLLGPTTPPKVERPRRNYSP